MTRTRSRPRPSATPGRSVPRPPRPWQRPAIVAVALVVVGIHVAAIAAMRTIAHDDAISYLAATGHEGAYADVLDDGDGLTTQWVAAHEWKRFVQVEDRLIFARIRRDLVDHDIHPPLYFWLLHLVVAAAGVHIGTGPALNLVLHLLTAIALWRLARRVFVDPLPAASAVLLWGLSPAVVNTGLATRPYTLMTLAAVLLMLLAVDIAEPAAPLTPARLSGIAVVTAGGLASQFQFGVVVVAVGAWVAIRRIVGAPGDASRGRAAHAVAAVAGAMAAGAVAAAVIAGDITELIARQREQTEPLTWAEFVLRVPRVPAALAEFAWHDPQGPFAVLVGVLLCLAGIAAAVLLRWTSRPQTPASAFDPRNGLGRAARDYDVGLRPAAALGVVWCFGAVAAGILGAYLAGVSPRFAVEPRYLAPVWPFAALTLVTLWVTATRWYRPRQDSPLRRALAIAIGVALVIGMVASVAPLLRRPDSDPSAVVASAGAVVTDNVARGVLPRVVWHLPDDMPVRAASPDSLAAAADAFDPPAGGPTLYVSVTGYEVVGPARARVLRAADRHGCVTPLDGSVWGIGDFFLVRPRTAADGAGAGEGCRRVETMIEHRTTARTPAANPSSQ